MRFRTTIVLALAALMTLAATAAHAQVQVGTEIEIEQGALLGWSGSSTDAVFTITLDGLQPGQYPEILDVDPEPIGTLLWSVLLADGVNENIIRVELDGWTDADILDWIPVELSDAGFNCASADDPNVGTSCGNNPNNWYLSELIAGAQILVDGIQNSWTGIDPDDGLALELVVHTQDINWADLRSGSDSGDLVFTIGL